jgi:ABC-type transport system involved in cytochrome bd biosynthesis fused ATPase/permease subunit
MFRRDGRTALVTGEGSGIGEAIARLFAEQGAHVLVADVQTDAVDRVTVSIATRVVLPADQQGQARRRKQASVQFDHVYKRFGAKTPVISDLNLAIRDRESLVLVGLSGCGKTTALRMIAGLQASARAASFSGIG